MEYRNAELKDIPGVSLLQQKYHVSTISEEDRPDGFVTTLFTEEQFRELIERENGLAIACDGDKIIAYAWRLPGTTGRHTPIPTYDKTCPIPSTSVKFFHRELYQYGPICIDGSIGTKVLPNLFEFSRRQMVDRYPILITFINHINPRSYIAHTRKLGLRSSKL